MIFYLIVISGVLACSASQLLLKKSATEEHRNRLAVMVNGKTILAYTVMFVTLVMNIFAMKNGVLLKEMSVLESLGFVFVPLLSAIFLSEKLSRKNIVAIIFVVLGEIVFYA